MDKLIVTADDCGLSKGINLATLDLFQKGIVTGADVMTSFAATQDSIELFTSYPALKIGAHLNLTDGFAVQVRESSPLTRGDARFRSNLNLIARALSPSRAFLSLVESELAAQINILVQRGLKPEHLSTHIQFHLLPSLRRIIIDLAQQYSVAWVRPHRLNSTVLPLNPVWHRAPSLSQSTGTDPTQRPDYIVVLKYWMGHRPQELWDVLDKLPGIVELIVHPCFEHDDSFPSFVPYGPPERRKEMLYLERLWQAKH
jgi:predicted glycoside hydrolase/deacetylase ChbG (UPF0249 family)